jgi:hypothetical protein
MSGLRADMPRHVPVTECTAVGCCCTECSVLLNSSPTGCAVIKALYRYLNLKGACADGSPALASQACLAHWPTCSAAAVSSNTTAGATLTRT